MINNLKLKARMFTDINRKLKRKLDQSLEDQRENDVNEDDGGDEDDVEDVNRICLLVERREQSGD